MPQQQHSNRSDKDIAAYRNAVHPSMSLERIDLLMKKFGVVHRRADEVNEKGMTIHWKTCTKFVNVGQCYYNDGLDTFYLRSSCNGGLLSIDYEDSTKDVHCLEIERAKVDKRYKRVSLSVQWPEDDYHKVKITTCEKHFRSSGQPTFFTVQDNNGTVSYNAEEDTHSFDISDNNSAFIKFRVRFWCWTSCRKGDFSNKQGQIRFIAKLSGPDVEDMMSFSAINVQRNPGRGAGVVPKRSDNENNWHIANRMVPSNLCGQMPFNGQGGVFLNNTNFVENNRNEPLKQLHIFVDIPLSFYDILGYGQAKVEINALKRDIASIANFRIQDAIKRKIAGNQDLVQENGTLRMAISNLQQIVVNNNRQAEALQIENNRLRMLLETSMNECPNNNERPTNM